jgi:1,4-dihydroxy-2-naphthoyl-CoA hydrolase
MVVSCRDAEVPVPELSGREQQIMAAFNSQGDATLAGRMGIRILEASAQRVVGTMPVQGNTQPYGILHGGASCVLAETLGSLGAALQAGPDRFTVGIEINATHHRSASSGLVTGVATVAHGGRTMSTFEIVITDEQDKRVCTARLSCLHRDAVPFGGSPIRERGVPAGSGSGGNADGA